MRNQTSAIYKVENNIYKFSNEYSLKECQQYIDELRKFYGIKERIAVTDGRGGIMARARIKNGKRVVQLPRWARNPYVIIHEFCHHYSHTMTGAFDHQEVFAKNLLNLVKNELDGYTYKVLKTQYKIQGVVTK